MLLGIMWYWWILIGFVWINLGYAFGEFNLRVHDDRYTQKWLKSNKLRAILWPLSSLDGYYIGLIIQEFSERKLEIRYKIIMSVIGPLKPVINLTIAVLVLIVFVMVFISDVFLPDILPEIIKSFFKSITSPIRRLAKINWHSTTT